MELPVSDDRAYLERLQESVEELPFFRLIGLQVVDIQPGRSVLSIEHRHDLTQPVGILHGGVTATLIDSGIAYAFLARDENRELVRAGGSLVAVDLRVKFFRPVSRGTITCTSTVTRMGRRILHGESVVTNEEGKEVARGDSTYTTVTRNDYTKGGSESLTTSALATVKG